MKASKLSIGNKEKSKIFGPLKIANQAFQQKYPGDRPDRQAVHTVYGGAHLFKSTTAASLGKVAIQSFLEYAPNFVVLAQVLQLPGYESLPKTKRSTNALVKKYKSLSDQTRKGQTFNLAYEVYEKVLAKLGREAVEDFRIDFEDGYRQGSRQRHQAK